MHSAPRRRPVPFNGYQSAEAWRAAHQPAPAPATTQQPATPTAYARLTWYLAALVAFLLLGMLVERCAANGPAARPEQEPPAPRGLQTYDFYDSDSITL